CTSSGDISEISRLYDEPGKRVTPSIVIVPPERGALIQGNSYLNGTFTPITIPRSGGTITMEGVTLLPGSSYSRDISEMSPDEVQDAIKNILESYDPDGGTTANYGDDFQQTYSYEHMLFTLGVDARYGIGSMEADLSIDTEKETNYVFYKFQQKFYDVVYTAPESSTSVFRDGDNFAEPDPLSPQIGPGNPPLYVHKVSYGRIVYFVAESEYNSTDIEATLRAAVDGKAFEGGLESGLTYEQVLDETRITTFVLGGNAGDAVQNVKAGSAEDRFKAITEFVGGYGNANFSAQNPAAPISYELRYLKDRQLARMSYTTTFDKKDCTSELVFPEPEPEDGKMWIRFTSVDDTATLYYGSGNTKIHSFKCVGSGACDESSGTRTAIHTWLTDNNYKLDQNHTFRLELDTGAGDGSVELNYYVDKTSNLKGTKEWFCEASIINNCPGKKTWYYTVNVNDGTWRNQ
ncbi:MAG: thiol-activated cytolysin family protein, partial [Chloroflexota bacterium]